MTTQEIRDNLNRLLMSIDEGKDQDIISSLKDKLDEVSATLMDRHYVKRVKSDSWPAAADPMLICDEDSEEDKTIRASAIFSLLIASRLHDGSKPVVEKKVLDFGCGQAHITKQIANAGAITVGYDIVNQGWERWDNKLTLTTDLDEAKAKGPYDIIVMYDVLDHAENKTPIELLGQAKEMLAPGGRIIVRCHPWCGRHGTHLWKLNKAYVHVVFNDKELERLGCKNMPTIKVTVPDLEYPRWFGESGLKIQWEKSTWEQAGMIFESNPDLKARVMAHYPTEKVIPYGLVEQVWRDFVVGV